MRRRLALAGTFVSALALASPAAADPNDLALNRLSMYQQPGMPGHYVFAGGCGTAATAFAQCEADNQLFVNLINELGGALAPPLLAPARTVGYNGLYVGYENTITGINGSGEYWHRGTEGNPTGGGNEGTGTAQIRSNVPNQLFVSHFHARKAFPYGFELGVHANWLHDSSMVSMGVDIRWALFEGFHSGIGYLPDFAVRGAVNTLVGNQQLYLTIIGVDAMISKPFSIGGAMTLTPYLGGQGLLIFGDSTVIDATPNRSSFQECTRRHVQAHPDPGSPSGQSSELICDSGSNAPMTGANDSRNEMVFLSTRIARIRGAGGLRLRVGYFTLGAEFLYDLIDPLWLNGADSVAGAGRPVVGQPTPSASLDLPHQWQVTFGAGVQF